MNEEHYLEMLNRSTPSIARQSVPSHPYPSLTTQFDGKYTVITNLRDIASFLQRSDKSILSYLASRTGSRPDQYKSRLYGEINPVKIEDALFKYFQHYIQCPNCSHYHTSVVSEMTVRCWACGHQWKNK